MGKFQVYEKKHTLQKYAFRSKGKEALKMARRGQRMKIALCKCDAASVFPKDGEIRLSLCECTGIRPSNIDRLKIEFVELIK